MKVGDKVRFLSETGGGVVVGFQSSGIALVEDEDGFQIPTRTSDLVVVNDDKQQMFAPKEPKKDVGQEKSVMGAPAASLNIKTGVGNKPFSQHEEEYADGDELNICVGIVPLDAKNISKTHFHFYIINDCNYFVTYAYSISDGDKWTLKAHGELEPNTKLLIAELPIEAVAEYENGAFQLIAYKQGRAFSIQPTMDVRLHIDPVKFYKLHTFSENDFFDEDAYVVPVVEKGKPVRQLVVNREELQEKMVEKKKVDITAPARKQHKATGNAGEPLVVDLHASELLETTAGMSAGDILNYQIETFRKTMEEFRHKKGMKIIFIHGKGDGILRRALVHELNYRFKTCTYQDASFQEYGYGATQITIR